MRPIITEELRFRKQICEFAIKDGNNAEAARHYHTSRQQVQRWLKRYDGSIDSLRPLSRRPHTQPNQHTTAELTIVRQMNTRYRHEGLAQVYVESCKRGYTRSSPWQNGKVERSHRRDGEHFYNRSFRTIEALCKAHK